MLVLIVTKTTNYELHGPTIETKVEQGRISTDALTRLKTAHTEHYATLNKLRTALQMRRLSFDEVSREAPSPHNKQYDAVLTIGGDGTLLSASQKMLGGGLVAGIRSSISSVGYLCAVGPDGVDALIERMAAGKLEEKTIMAARVGAEIARADTGFTVSTPPVLNDFLYTNANPAATTRYKVTYKGESEAHRSSGIWVATGCGSTAAILAAGGMRRPAEDQLFQFRMRELYKLGHQHPKIEGDVFDPDVDSFEFENRCPSALLAMDGQHGMMELTYGDRVRFMRAPPVQLVRPFT